MKDLIGKYKAVFWDFDGVIKESVEVKTKTFQELFRSFGEEVVTKVTDHHIQNGGMSRFKKIPIYLGYAGIAAEQAIVDDYCKHFGELVEDAVVNAEWVPGAESLISQQAGEGRYYVLVTATPQEEIETILQRLSIDNYFSDIFGAPVSKADGIQQALDRYGIEKAAALMIGDSKADYEAALKCGTDFLLRRTPENRVSMPGYNGPWINNFTDHVQQ